MTISESEWRRILAGMGCKPKVVERWVTPLADEVRLDRFSRGEADFVDWLPQIMWESDKLEKVEESLLYNPERICAVWPGRFPTLASATPLMMNAERLANTVYCDRMGNGNYASGHGFKYRGRCPIMLTGLAAYLHMGGIMGQDLDVMPELLLQPHYGIEASLLWWEDGIPDSMLGDQTRIRRRVQGGTLGLPECIALKGRLVALLH